ncbi:ankyrin repeat domain-containing protein [Myxococcus sp. K15C18031901]|uniref:ankyrin repeat domain-containing protein n=1 Tax=Myxococcus dinghuensis TaxID=2906761 RepID=UPI0020A7BD35|nr:ankyrin repeat domain-containing protein [Myxococcus dinghuensis]MCP3098502.1 ankyrin repeat domain-containing protein [Myxococcus dinghuensis]
MTVRQDNEATLALRSICSSKARWHAELDAEAVRRWVSQGADVSAPGEHGMTALHLAVRPPSSKSEPLPSLEVAQALVDAGADVNARDVHQRTPLLCASTVEDEGPGEARAMELIRLLRAAGATAPSDVKDARGGAFTPASARLLKEVLEAGAVVDARDAQGRTPLHRVANLGHDAQVRLLLERGADVNAIDGLGRTPLGVALREMGKPWVAHNQRTPGFNRAIQALEGAGGKPSVPFPWSEDPFAPFPIDAAAVRAELGAATLSFSHAFDSAQEIATGLHGYGDPSSSLDMLRRVASALGVAPRTVRLKGAQDLRAPFFHHGDLEVDGDLDLLAPFAVTGSVTVRGVVKDWANGSLVVILGDLRCHGLFTDCEFTVGGDIHARDVVLGYYNDHILAAERIRARVVIEDDHCVLATVEADHHFDLDTYQCGEDVAERLEQLFTPECFREQEPAGDGEEAEPARLDNHALFHRIRKGLPIFR